MAYTTIDKPSDYFETILYSGNGGTQSITSLDFQPDWCWLKARAGANVSDHRSVDSVRGATKELFQNATSPEETNTNGLTAFNSNGFSLGSSGGTNNSNTTYASWNWKAGTSFTNDASATGIGSIDSAGSVNQDAGFSIVSFTGGGANATIKHGLTSKPSMIIVKARGQASTWSVYHASLGATKFLRLEGNNAVGTEAGWWNNTEPTSSVFSIGTNHYANTQIAYCFSEKQGYSKFGSYIGNGNADGTFVYLGFKPAWLLVKSTATNDWILHDTKRSPHNVSNVTLFPNGSDADVTNTIYNQDILSNGFKARTTHARLNGSGVSYIYMAFAENPFVTSTGVPATAR